MHTNGNTAIKASCPSVVTVVAPDRLRLHQSVGIGVMRRVEDIGRDACLGDLAKIHHHKSVGHVPDNG